MKHHHDHTSRHAGRVCHGGTVRVQPHAEPRSARTAETAAACREAAGRVLAQTRTAWGLTA